MAEKLTKNEAVRLALIELGRDADRVQIQTFVKDRFNIEMNLDHVSTSRGLAMRKLAEAEMAPAVAPENSLPRPETVAAGKGETAPITKKDAVRQALAALGKKAMPMAIQGWVRDNLGIEMSAGHISTTKGGLLKPARKKKAGKQAAAAKRAVPTKKPAAAQPAPMKPASKAVSGKGVDVDDVLTLKELVDRVGPKTLRTLIGVMAK